jgi:hypothetical protein
MAGPSIEPQLLFYDEERRPARSALVTFLYRTVFSFVCFRLFLSHSYALFIRSSFLAELGQQAE